MDFYFKHQVYGKIRSDFLNTYSVIPKDHPERIKFAELFAKMQKENKFSSA